MRLGDHHDRGMGQRTTREDEEFEAVVEHRGIAAVLVDDGFDLVDVVAEERGGQLGLAGVHPVDVPAEGVDFAIVGDVAVGVGALPARERVRAEARVDEGQGAFHARVGEVRVVGRDLRGREHALVDDGACGEAGHVEEAATGGSTVADLVEHSPADDEELPLESEVVLDGGVASDEGHADFRFLGLGGVAEGGVVGGHGAPAEKLLSLGPDHAFETLLDLVTKLGVLREEDHGDAVLPRRREGDVLFLGHGGEEGVRKLEKDAGAVAGVLLEAAGSAVLEVDEDLQALADDFVGGLALHVHDKPDTAGFVLELRVVESLAGGLLHGRCKWVKVGRTQKVREIVRSRKEKLGRRITLEQRPCQSPRLRPTS
jgi:hypothetical protein